MNPTFQLAVLCALSVTVWGQAGGSAVPRFEDFPAGAVFNGKPAPPRLVQARDRAFRTRIREGAASGPNFAGHFTIVEWGCGSACVSIAVLDAKDGAIIHPVPFEILGWGMQMRYEDKYSPLQDRFRPLSYRTDSRLLTVRGCPEDENCASYFYELTPDAKFKLIRKLRAVPVTPP